MWAFFPLFVFTGQNEEGATGVEEGPTTESELLPLCSSGSHTGGAMHVHTCTHMHTHRKAHTGLLACAHFIRRGGARDEGWRVRLREAQGVGWGWGEGTETRAPHLHQPGRRSILKAALSLHGRAGWAGGQGGSICGGQWSCWSTQGAPRYPVIHDNQREREVGEVVGGREWWETKSERRRERGSDRENMEKLSCGQRALSWSKV